MERTVLPAALPGTVSARSPSRFAVWVRGPPTGRASVFRHCPPDEEERAIELALEEASVLDDAEAA
jgi:hypothetical protein